MSVFQAFVVNKTETEFTAGVQTISMDDLPEGDVVVRVHYSSVNYKDGLASIPDGKIVKTYPFVPGIDLAGVVVSSHHPRFREGDEVIATGYEIGVTHFGGYSEYARLHGDWLVPLPKGLTLKEAMAIGTAGFTAALSIHRLEEQGLTPERGPVLVTGATGGVGSLAVSMLAKRGYTVEASTGKAAEHDYLRALGAKEVLTREDVTAERIRPLDQQRWAAAVDPVGGRTLATVLSRIRYGGAVAVSGLTGGVEVPTTVHPFILRGISLLGIDSVYCPMELRLRIWERLAGDLKPDLERIVQEISLAELPQALERILRGELRGRTVVRLG